MQEASTPDDISLFGTFIPTVSLGIGSTFCVTNAGTSRVNARVLFTKCCRETSADYHPSLECESFTSFKIELDRTIELNCC